MRILIITGGDSPERKVSFMSAKGVKAALLKRGHKVKVYDLKKGYEGLAKFIPNFDILFPVIHGEEGEGGQLHKFLSKFKKPIVGTRNYRGLNKAFYKISSKEFCDKNNILTAPWKKIRRKRDVVKFGFPCVLKSSSGGSSREVEVLKTKEDLKKYSVKRLINSGLKLFVEKYLSGTEVTAGIFNGEALPLIEISHSSKEGWFDYKTKYWGEIKEIPFAPSLSKDLQKEIQGIALKIHSMLDLGTYSRIDFIVVGVKPYVTEINTIPGLTAASSLPTAASAAGIPFEDLCEKLVSLAK